MTFNKHNTFLLVVLMTAAVASVFSCKKKEEDTVYNYLRGGLKFTSVSYIPQSSRTGAWIADVDEWTDCYEFVPFGVTHPLEGGTVGYYFLVTPGMGTSDTTKWLNGNYHFDERGSFRYHFGDSLGTYKVYSSCFGSEHYYGTSYTSYVTVVKPGIEGSVKTPFKEGEEFFVDPRDNNTYIVVKIGETSWLKPNLAYSGTEAEPLGIGYRDYDIMSGVFGRFYTWEEAQKACPEGWTLPSDADWAAAAATVKAGDDIVAGKQWADCAGGFIDRSMVFNNDKETVFWDYWPKVKADNSTSLALISAGFGTKSSNNFEGAQEMAVLWTSTETEGGKGVYRYIRDSYPDVYMGQSDKTDFLANVRCIKK